MLDDGQLLTAMRGEQPVEAVCKTAGITKAEFAAALDADLRRRLPPTDLKLRGGVTAPVEILRDRYGVPHIYAQSTADLYVGLGLTMGQDRLWQMDVFRRRGQGRLSEVLGADHLTLDITHRTLSLDRLGHREADLIDERTGEVLRAFVAGINRAIEEAGHNLPVEFNLLGYRPEPWSVADVLVAIRGFWWQLNGRLASIVVGEAAQRHLPDGSLRDAFMTPEFAHEPIVPRGEDYPPAGLVPSVPGGYASLLPAGTDISAIGSNNWAVGGKRTETGAGVLGSDPHLPFGLPGNWYECRLSGPEDDAVGAAWAGMPGIWFGRNRRIAWGITNNNVSLRDVYVEEVNPNDPGQYRDGDCWLPFAERTVEIPVRGREPERLTVRETTRGPIVNHIVSKVDEAGDPPLSLRWVGQERLENVKALLAVNRSSTWAEFRAALADWPLPTFNWVFADVDGHVGYQCASRIPIRGRVTRGFRDANNPDDRWLGYIPFDAMPRRDDPAEGFVATANNAAVAKDYPYPFYGAFASGDRALRIRDRITNTESFDAEACRIVQQDTYSAYAERISQALLTRLAGQSDPAVGLLASQLRDWNFCYDLDATAPGFFDMFTRVWSARIAAERFPAHLAGQVAGQGTVGADLLEADDLPWFDGDKSAIILDCVRQAVAEVKERFGTDPAGWTWDHIHLAHFKHPLSNSFVSSRFDVGPRGVSGGASTVRNTGLGTAPLFSSASGAEYQLIADLSDGGILANQNIGQSGQPGSPHFGDQFTNWIEGRYHRVSLDRASVEAETTATIRIEPNGEKELSMEVLLYAYRDDPAAIVSRCQELGLKQVCLLLEGMPGYTETGVPEPRSLRAIAQALADEGVTLSSGNGSTGRNPELLTDPKGHRKELDALLRMLESLGGAGVGALLYYQHFPYPVDPDDHARYWDGLIANTQELVTQAEATNVKLAHHAVWRCLPPTCREDALGRETKMEGYPEYRHEQWDGPYLLSSHLDVARLIDAVPSTHNGICFCTGMHIMGGDVPTLVDRFKGRINHAQMRDIRGRWPFAEEVFLGEGEIDFSTILRLLQDAGYDGVIGPEHLGDPRWPGDDPEAAAIAFLRQHLPEEKKN